MESCKLECADIYLVYLYIYMHIYNQLSINWNVNEFRCHLLYLEARILHFANHWLNFEAEGTEEPMGRGRFSWGMILKILT